MTDRLAQLRTAAHQADATLDRARQSVERAVRKGDERLITRTRAVLAAASADADRAHEQLAAYRRGLPAGLGGMDAAELLAERTLSNWDGPFPDDPCPSG